METKVVISLVQRVAAVAVGASRAQVIAAAGDLARLRAWCDSRELVLARAAAEASPAPEADLAAGGRASARDADRAMSRAGVGDAAPSFEAALAEGDIGAGHLDAFGAGLRSLPADRRNDLLAQADELATIAAGVSADEFGRVVRRRARALSGDDGEGRLQRQRSASRLRTWTDRETGMWRLAGSFDPLTGVLINGRLQAELAALFADGAPDGCPTDPGEKQDHLRALALAAICTAGADGAAGPADGPEFSSGSSGSSGSSRSRSGGASRGRPEVTVVFDTRNLDEHGRPRVDWGLDVELPTSVVAHLARSGSMRPVVFDGHHVVSAPGRLQLGRSTRIANAAQRRVLRIWYPSCAIPDCPVRFAYTKAHHVEWWRHGGCTDLDNLVPLCERHHHRVHDDGWQLHLAADRTLTITYPDGDVRITGPPAGVAA